MQNIRNCRIVIFKASIPPPPKRVRIRRAGSRSILARVVRSVPDDRPIVESWRQRTRARLKVAKSTSMIARNAAS